jgi:hypothetical protein
MKKRLCMKREALCVEGVQIGSPAVSGPVATTNRCIQLHKLLQSIVRTYRYFKFVPYASVSAFYA